MILILLTGQMAVRAEAPADHREVLPSDQWQLLLGDESSQVTVKLPQQGGRGVSLILPLKPDGTRSGVSARGLANDGAGVFLEIGPSGDRVVDVGSPYTGARTFDIRSKPAPEPGPRYFVVAAWGDKPWWEVEATNVVVVAEGGASHLRSVDMEGGAYAGAEVRGFYNPRGNFHPQLSAQYASGRSHTFEIEHMLIGSFGPLHTLFKAPNSGNSTLTGPEGHKECPCNSYDLVGPHARPAGTYVFTDDTIAGQRWSEPHGTWIDLPFPFPTP